MLPPVRHCLDHKVTAATRRPWKALEQEGRGSARERGYTKAWDRARAAYLTRAPLCAHCSPRPVPATVLDHIVPHKGNLSTFWLPENWQGLCAAHHAEKTRRENRMVPCHHQQHVRVGRLGMVCTHCGAREGGAKSLHLQSGDPAGPPSRAHGQVSSEIQTGQVD